jgi:hypothetical protein
LLKEPAAFAGKKLMRLSFGAGDGFAFFVNDLTFFVFISSLLLTLSVKI